MTEYDKEEVWKDIENYEGLYQVSNLGRVKSLNYGHTGEEKILKQFKVKKYWQIELCKNGVGKGFFVHRLVGKTFIPNPLNLPEINHKDENPSNNRAENLEWISHRDNINFGTHNQRMTESLTNHPSLSKKVLQFTKEGDFLKEHPSVSEAYRQTRISISSISQCCSGKLKSAGGYKWKYKDKNDEIWNNF